MSLIEDAKAAKAAGLSYGQYMQQRQHREYVRFYGKKCLNCGTPLVGSKQKYCSKECREDMRWKISNGGKFV